MHSQLRRKSAPVLKVSCYETHEFSTCNGDEGTGLGFNGHNTLRAGLKASTAVPHSLQHLLTAGISRLVNTVSMSQAGMTEWRDSAPMRALAMRNMP